MKQFKKLILTSALLLVSYLGFSQTVPTAQMRIADRTTTFDQNLPAGTQIFCESDSTLWQVGINGVAGTLSITTGRSSLVFMNKEVLFTLDQFEAVANVTGPGTYTLSFTPSKATTGVTVMYNGSALRPTTDYTTSGTTLTINADQKKFDNLVVSYSYWY
jgi:hypothetical protein